LLRRALGYFVVVESAIALLSFAVVGAIDVAGAADAGSRDWAFIKVFTTLAQARAAFCCHHWFLWMFGVKLIER
jgi:hypothetical protein